MGAALSEAMRRYLEDPNYRPPTPLEILAQRAENPQLFPGAYNPSAYAGNFRSPLPNAAGRMLPSNRPPVTAQRSTAQTGSYRPSFSGLQSRKYTGLSNNDNTYSGRITQPQAEPSASNQNGSGKSAGPVLNDGWELYNKPNGHVALRPSTVVPKNNPLPKNTRQSYSGLQSQKYTGISSNGNAHVVGEIGPLERILIEGGKRAYKGFYPNVPLGIDEQTFYDRMRPGGLYDGSTIMGRLNYASARIMNPIYKTADFAGRVMNAGLHGGAAIAGQTAEELGLGKGDALRRDLLGMAETFMPKVGRGSGLVGSAPWAQQQKKILARNPQWVLEYPTSKQFVKTQDGGVNLGVIDPAVEAASDGRFPTAPIRMQKGLSGEDGYGARHITPDKHENAQKLGYSNGVDLIKDVAKNHNVAVEQVNDRLLLVKQEGHNRYAIAEYRPQGFWRNLFGRNDEYYGVTTGYPENFGRNVTNPKRSELYRTINKRGGNILWQKN